MKITIEMAIENRGCFSEKQVRDLVNGRKWIHHKTLINLGLKPKEIIWFIEKIKLGGKQRFLLYADVAESTLHIYETKYPEDKRPREAIQAIRDYVSEKITLKELEAAAEAARASNAAAYAAANAAARAAANAADYAAYAVVYAADATCDDLDSCAYAVYAAVAAYNAAYCSDIAEKKNQIKLIDAFLRKIK